MKHAAQQTRIPASRASQAAEQTRMPVQHTVQPGAQRSQMVQLAQKNRVTPPRMKLAFYVAVAIVAALLFVGLSRIATSSGYQSPYDWKGLDTSGEFYT